MVILKERVGRSYSYLRAAKLRREFPFDTDSLTVTGHTSQLADSTRFDCLKCPCSFFNFMSLKSILSYITLHYITYS